MLQWPAKVFNTPNKVFTFLCHLSIFHDAFKSKLILSSVALRSDGMPQCRDLSSQEMAKQSLTVLNYYSAFSHPNEQTLMAHTHTGSRWLEHVFLQIKGFIIYLFLRKKKYREEGRQDAYNAFRKYSHPSTFVTFCCYSLNLKWIKFQFFVTDRQKIPHNDKVKLGEHSVERIPPPRNV